MNIYEAIRLIHQRKNITGRLEAGDVLCNALVRVMAILPEVRDGADVLISAREVRRALSPTHE